jgi:hypothetical protein
MTLTEQVRLHTQRMEKMRKVARDYRDAVNEETAALREGRMLDERHTAATWAAVNAGELVLKTALELVEEMEPLDG